MNILMLNYEYPPLGGGAGNATAALLRQFARDPGLSVDLITSSAAEARLERPFANVAIHFLDIGKRGGLHYQTERDLLAFAWLCWRRMRRLTAARPYALCHAFFGIPCGPVARASRLPYIISLRGSDVPFYNERFRHADRLLFRRLSAGLWRDARHVVANSRGLRELALRTAPGRRIEVIPNGVDTAVFRPGPRRRQGGLRVLCVARLIRRKGVEHLIAAAARLGDVPGLRVTIVGTGDREGPLRVLAREAGLAGRVTFTGRVPHGDLPDCYRDSDVFVMPSLNEGMSNTALEAMACGLPVLMTDTGGTTELLHDGANGFLIAKRSPEDIAAKLCRYAARPELIAEHGARSRSIAEGMGWDHVAAAYRRLYEQTAARTAPGGQLPEGRT